ncbi:hypothetical protein UCRNP2_3114 [Neofusicoccum parvum UCRNP2]|uniref:Uncharacterized protein n=1 Tax=Botryosphaeria parva (strain UCR-NP2) TaxID=1287680 RepID=R1GP85_BOTPV|nr:hypothetical protein UCRNP2_3114 [Neofusicoccum parvum UCRNP2]
MDVAELSMPTSEQLEQLRIAQLLIERILAIARSLLGSNRFVDVVTYRVGTSQDPDYIAELIEHTGPRDAVTVILGRGGSRNVALWLLLDRTERELNRTMVGRSSQHGAGHINTRRMGNPSA